MQIGRIYTGLQASRRARITSISSPRAVKLVAMIASSSLSGVHSEILQAIVERKYKSAQLLFMIILRPDKQNLPLDGCVYLYTENLTGFCIIYAGGAYLVIDIKN